MADLDQFQTTRVSSRLYAKNTSEDHDGKDANRAETPGPAEAPTVTSKGTVDLTKGRKGLSISRIAASTKKNPKRKRVSDDDGFMLPSQKRAKPARLPSGSNKVLDVQPTPDRGMNLPLTGRVSMRGVVDSQSSSPLSSAPSSPVLEASMKSIARTTIEANPTTSKVEMEQLLTPPSSVDSFEYAESEASPSVSTKRTRKQTTFLWDFVPTGTAVDVLIEPYEQSTEKVYEMPATIQAAARPKAQGPQSYQQPQHPSSKLTVDKTRRKLTSTAEAAKMKTKSVSKSANKSRAQVTKSTVKSSKITLEKGKDKASKAKKAGVQGKITSSKGRNPAKKQSASLISKLPLPQPDLGKLALSWKLSTRQVLESKPEPRGKPEAWAASRQALCETLPYFKRPQGGCYSNDGHVYGFLFDSIGHCREYMDEDVIICRAGGGMEQDPAGGMVQGKHQLLSDSQVQAVLNDIAHKNPVVVICGNRNGKAPCKMPHLYSVLDWYKPIMVWSEKTVGKGNKIWTTVKYRFERLNRHKPAWHGPAERQVTDEERAIAGDLQWKNCKQCMKVYPQVYLRAWMCLNQDCPRFWKVNGSNAPYGTQGLEYNPAFLLNISGSWSTSSTARDEPEPAPLRPPLPAIGGAIGDSLTYVNTRGICCPECGKCNSRRLFWGWLCENCGFKLPAIHRPVLPAMLHTPWDAAPTLVRNKHIHGVYLKVEHKYGYKISTYTFSGVEGRFVHAAATKQILEEKDGPNSMFAAMQMEDLGLERRRFDTSKATARSGLPVVDENQAMEAQSVSSPEEATMVEQALDVRLEPEKTESINKKDGIADGDLMTAFSMNYGMPYKFVASGGSRPFDGAPKPVTEARRRLNWAAKAFLNNPEEDQDLNEELIFAYLQGQKIEYHDDGEEGLGPRIATLSLGGRAKMHLRMKMKHYVGCSKTGILTEERPVHGSIMYEKRLQMWEGLQLIKHDSAAYNKRRKEVPKEIGIFDKRKKKAEDSVIITLSHGDIALMDGYDIQKYFEHKIVPEDHLRFALTCRTVLETHLKPEELPDYAVEVDSQIYGGPCI